MPMNMANTTTARMLPLASAAKGFWNRLAMCLQVGHADHDGGEDQRDQHHLQQADEDAPGQGAGVEHALAHGCVGWQRAGQPADGDTQAGRDKNLQVETGQRGGSSNR
jgi:hypothetical protein